MKGKFRWLFYFSLTCLVLSALFYTLNYLIFHDPHEMFFLMFEDLGFIFLDVLLVIILIERLLAQREKRMIFKKLNMVIGTFFSEVGLKLLGLLSPCSQDCDVLKRELNISAEWTHKDFQKAASIIQSYKFDLQIDPGSMADIKAFLEEKRNFLIMLLENPNLLEHERFTDVLWAVFHLAEELTLRERDLGRLPESDYQHLLNDAKRVFSSLTAEWIVYTEHLKESYPYLFSLAIRINPFNPHPDPTVK